MKTVLIDNFDSFTYNIVHYIEEINNERPVVYRNNAFTLEAIEEFDSIVLSPGPGLPKDAGLTMQVIEKYHKHKIMLGICLGHQAIAQFFGAKLKNLKTVHHGVSCKLINPNDSVLYKNTIDYTVGRYHSWVVKKDTLPDTLLTTSTDDKGEVMSLKHKSLPIHSVQFHPESVLTPCGKQMLYNFFNFYNG